MAKKWTFEELQARKELDDPADSTDLTFDEIEILVNDFSPERAGQEYDRCHYASPAMMRRERAERFTYYERFLRFKLGIGEKPVRPDFSHKSNLEMQDEIDGR